MIEVKAPNTIEDQIPKRVFLAGSIEMGSAEPWHQRVIDDLKSYDGFLLNPRRDHWDPSWEQSIKNPQFKEQVNWEMDGLEQSDFIFMYFDPNTKSPISLLEFGLYLYSGNLIVVCPHGFWRRGNLEIACERAGIELHETLEAGLNTLKSKLVRSPLA